MFNSQYHLEGGERLLYLSPPITKKDTPLDLWKHVPHLGVILAHVMSEPKATHLEWSPEEEKATV
jgi:hypothetical protein